LGQSLLEAKIQPALISCEETFGFYGKLASDVFAYGVPLGGILQPERERFQVQNIAGSENGRVVFAVQDPIRNHVTIAPYTRKGNRQQPDDETAEGHTNVNWRPQFLK